MYVLLSSRRTLFNKLQIYTLILSTYSLFWNNYANLSFFSSDNIKCHLLVLLWPILKGDVFPHVTSGSCHLSTRINGSHFLEFQYVLYLSLKRDLLTLKEYKQHCSFPRNPRWRPKGDYEGQFKFRFSEWKLPLYSCNHAFLCCLIVKDYDVTCFSCSPRVSNKPKFSANSWWTKNKSRCHTTSTQYLTPLSLRTKFAN